MTWAWCGAAGSDGFRVVAKIAGVSGRLAVADNPALTGATFFGPVSPGVAGTVSITATGLASEARWYWAVEDDGVLDLAWLGQARTHPAVGTPFSFTFAAAGDSGLVGAPGDDSFITSQVSDKPIFDTVRNHDPLFFIHLGDLHYRNIISGLVADYRTAYNDVLTFNGTLGADARQGRLYRNVPTVYLWDDHCYSNNDSDGTYTGKAAAAQAYRECVPSYPLADQDGIFHAWQVGRVQFIAWDSRYFRSADSDPDGPDKTMLGSAQRPWLEQVLTTSAAQALVVCSPVQWMSGFVDSWGGFANERNELAALFTSTGWADRMVMIQADKHSLALDSGANNAWGGWPNYLLASLDAGAVVTNTGPYDIGITDGRDRYGLLTVTDTGDQINITCTGYINGTVWRSHGITIDTSDGGGGGGGEPVPAPTTAVARTRVTWLGCNLVTGAVVAELPDITPSGSISRVLGAYTSASLQMPIPLAGPAAIPQSIWEAATSPGTSMIVAVVNDVPTWAGMVLTREGGTDGILQLGCASLEAYLDRRYVADHNWTGRDEALIASDLLADAQLGGIGLIIDAPITGTARDRTYKNSDDATVYSRLRELMGVENGPEWTVDLDWANTDRTAVAKIWRLRKRIGIAATKPDAVFTVTSSSVFSSGGSSESTYTYREDYSDGRGANVVLATSSGEGEDRPTSTAQKAVLPGWPIYERRISPSTSIKDVATLNAHAVAELALRKTGSKVFQIKTRWDVYPRLNLDWRLGDDVAWELAGHRHPHGVVGQGRCIGWELDIRAGVVAPILWEPGS